MRRFGHGMIPDKVFLLKEGKEALEEPMSPNDLVFGWPKFRRNNYFPQKPASKKVINRKKIFS